MVTLTGPLISTETLAAALDADPASVQIVDGSWRLDPNAPPARQSFLERHIPGAVFFNIDAIADQTVDLPHMLPTPTFFAKAVATLGLTPERSTVVYDDVGLFSAARVWWTFKAMGWSKIAVLDGGLPKWLSENRPVETGESAVAPTSPRLSDAASGFRAADADDVLKAIEKKSATVLDARPAVRFQGAAPEPRAGLRSGAMPGALNIPFANLLTEDGQLKTPAALEEIFAKSGLSPDASIIASCGSGVTAAVIILALEVLGRTDHALYDGAFAEWGQESEAARFPVVKAGAG